MSSSLSELNKAPALLNLACDLAEAASRWDMDRLKFLEQIRSPNRIQLAFIQIYENLKLYRPFIPDAVLQFNRDNARHSPHDEDYMEEHTTLVFTDVQNSTVLWEQCESAMRKAIKMHHVIMRRLIAQHSGYEVKTEGDAFMVAFPDPSDAIEWCTAAQKALLEADWPGEILALPDGCRQLTPDGHVIWNGLRVRMGMHTGTCKVEVDPTTCRKDYYGPMVNTAARIAGLPVGGQIVCSGATFEQQQQSGCWLHGCQMLPCGMYRLKGISQMVEVYQIIPHMLQSRTILPPPRHSQSPKDRHRPAEDMSTSSFSSQKVDGMKVSLGVLMLAKVCLPSDAGADLDVMLSTTNEMITAAVLQAKVTHGVVDTFGPGWVLMSWNVVTRAQMTNAVTAAHQLQGAVAEPFAREQAKLRVALWAGDVASGLLGSAQHKRVVLAGKGVEELKALVDLAAVTEVPVVCNQKMSGLLKTCAVTRAVDTVLFPHDPIPETVFAVQDGSPLEEEPLGSALRLVREQKYRQALDELRSFEAGHPNDQPAKQWLANLTPIDRIPEGGYARKVGLPSVEIHESEHATALAAWRWSARRSGHSSTLLQSFSGVLPLMDANL